METDSRQEEIKQSQPTVFGKIPIIAIIFPPIGLLMLIQYVLRKKDKKDALKED